LSVAFITFRSVASLTALISACFSGRGLSLSGLSIGK
jgi:hypothetical protein